MTKSIYLGLDWNCYTPWKEANDQMGGTERLLVTIGKWLEEEGYEVCKERNLTKEFDLAIFSNSSNDTIRAKKKIVFAGSWHTDASSYPYDEVVNVSEFMRENTKRGIVIPAPFTNDVLKYREGMTVPTRVFCHANPAKHYSHSLKICKLLDKQNIDYHFIHIAGNRLYSDTFPECISFEHHPNMYYRGILKRQEMLGLLSSAQVFILPNFTAKSETFGVCAAEAMAMGIPTILTNREPYNSCFPESFLCNSEEEIADKIIECMDMGKIDYDVFRYSEEVIKNQWIRLIERMI